MAKVVHYFKNADMRCSHTGLTKLAAKGKLNPNELGESEFLLFVNRRQTMFKLLGANNILVHVKSSRGRVDLRVLQYLPTAFSGKTFDYKAALKKVLERDLTRK